MDRTVHRQPRVEIGRSLAGEGESAELSKQKCQPWGGRGPDRTRPALSLNEWHCVCPDSWRSEGQPSPAR